MDQLSLPGTDATRKRLERPQGRIARHQRFRLGEQFGDLTGPTLAAVLSQLHRGDPRRWADLCAHAISTDTDLYSLYDSRIERVLQADHVIAPPKAARGIASAELQAELVNEVVNGIPRWSDALRSMLDAIAVGFSATEILWRRDGARRLYKVEELVFRDANRFRYGPEWGKGLHRDLRLSDRGTKRGSDTYGDMLAPNKWVTHFHPGKASNPGRYGLMHASIYAWMFMRWNQKGWILYNEKYGHPMVHAFVLKDATEAVKQDILDKLEEFTYDHVGVFEEGTTINVQELTGKGGDTMSTFDDRFKAKLDALWLGSSDMTSPGEHGSQAAVEGRIGALADPRMVGDGARLAESLQHTLFRYIILENLHKLGNLRERDIVLPEMRLKTADDEVSVDEADKAEEKAAEAETAAPMSSDRAAALSDVVARVASGGLPASSARHIMLSAFPDVAPARVDAMLSPFEAPARAVAASAKPLSPLELALAGKL